MCYFVMKLIYSFKLQFSVIHNVFMAHALGQGSAHVKQGGQHMLVTLVSGLCISATLGEHWEVDKWHHHLVWCSIQALFF